jgi:hypothetical protein
MRAAILLAAVFWLGSGGLALAGAQIATTPVACPAWAEAIPDPHGPGLVDRWCYSFQAAAGEQVKAHCTGQGHYITGDEYTFPCAAQIGPDHGSDFVGNGSAWITYTCPRTGTFVLLTLAAGRQSFFAGESFELEVAALPPCTPDANSLCLWGRFRASADWQAEDGSIQHAAAVTLTDESGYFSFFGASNVELVLKVHDGCAVNQWWWAFAAGLTNVQVSVTLTDTATNASLTYVNPSGVAFPSIQDTVAFPCP